MRRHRRALRRRLGMLRRRVVAVLEPHQVTALVPAEAIPGEHRLAPSGVPSSRLPATSVPARSRASRSTRWLRTAWLRAAAKAEASLGDHGRAARHLAAAVRLGDDRAAAWRALAAAARHIGPNEPVMDQHVGTAWRPAGQLDVAEQAAARAVAIAGAAADWRQLSEIQSDRGHHAEAVASAERATSLAPADAAGWFLLGRARLRETFPRGAQTPTEMTAIRDAWHRALERDPGHQSAGYHLVRSLVTSAEWPEAFVVAAGGRGAGRPRSGWVRDVTSTVGDGDLAALSAELPRDAWYVLSAEQFGAGQVGTATRVRAVMALNVLGGDGSLASLGLGGFLERARAMIALDRFDAAERFLAAAPRRALPRADRDAIRKLRADLALLRGDAEPCREALDIHGPGDAAQARFAAMVGGRRVAVVGPAPSPVAHGASIDAYDVVIRTKFRPGGASLDPAFDGARTDVAYYSDSSACLDGAEIAAALDVGQLRMAVLRPTARRAAPLPVADAASVRYAPSEHGATFHATHLAIQRIVHDVLRYRPAELTVFNANLFHGERHYVEGYEDEVERVYQRNNLVQVRSMAMHDLRADFEFLRRLRAAGLVGVDDVLGGVLDLGAAGYLQGLDDLGSMVGR